MKTSRPRWLLLLLGIVVALLLSRAAQKTARADLVECPPGFRWDRMSGVGCVQEDCFQVANAHLSYTGQCICNDGYVGCYEPVDYTSFDSNRCRPFCPFSRLVKCIPQGQACPTRPTGPTPTATRVTPSPPPPTFTRTRTPTRTPTQSATPTPTPDLKVGRIEVTQAIQDVDNTVNLVEDKKTVVRVFVDISAVPGYAIVHGVTAVLRATRDGAPLAPDALQPFNGPIDAPRNPDRRQQDHSLNFLLPRAWLSGTVVLEAEVNPDRTIPEVTYANNIGWETAVFELRCPLQIGYVPIVYSPDPAVGSHAPTGRIRSPPIEVLKLYPISSFNGLIYYQAWPHLVWKENLVPDDGEELRARLRDLLDMTTWRRPLRVPLNQLLGWLPNLDGVPAAFRIGWTGWSDPLRDSNPEGTDQVDLVQDWLHTDPRFPLFRGLPMSGWTLAHEMAHNFGRRHPDNLPDAGPPGNVAHDPNEHSWPYPNSRIQEVGFDTFDLQVKVPDDHDPVYPRHFDLMTYWPGPLRWISPYTYGGLFDALWLPCELGPGGTRTPTPTPSPTRSPTPTPTPLCQWWYPFSGNYLESEWRWVREDRSHWSLTARQGYLRIVTQHGSLVRDQNDARNLLLQEAPGNYQASTRLDFQPGVDGQAAGLLIYEDDDNYLFVGRAYDGGQQALTILEEGGVAWGWSEPFDANSTCLTVVRSGTTFSTYYGLTENDFLPLFDWQSGMVNPRIGLATFNLYSGAPEISADFDYFCVDTWSNDSPPWQSMPGPGAGALVAAAAPATSGAASPPGTSSSAGTSSYWLVRGELSRSGSGRLSPVYPVMLSESPRNPVPGTGYCAVLRAANGTELSSYCFDESFVNYETQEPVDTAIFSLWLPSRSDAANLELRQGSSVLDRIARSAHAPQVTVTQPQGGESWDGEQSIRWTASDADGDPLQFAVMFSPDGKQSWLALNVDITETEYVVDASELPGTTQGYVRIVATDGLNTTAADCARAVAIANHPPVVSISFPADGATWRPGVLLTLGGSAFDPEEGPLDGSRLTWTSDRDGTLGQGTGVDVPRLSKGLHHITLMAQDSQGQTGSDSILLYIGRDMFLPVLLKGHAAELPGPTVTTWPTSGPTQTGQPTFTRTLVATPTRSPTSWPTSTRQPTPTWTRTPTLTATPQVTATPVSLYSDDFGDPGSGWQVADDANRRTGYLNGEYQILVKTTNLWVATSPGFRCIDCAVEVKGRFASATYGAYGIAFGITDQWDAYVFRVNGTQQYSLRSKSSDGTWATIIGWTTSTAINAGQATNRLRVVRDWDSIDLYVNDQYLTSVTDSSLTGNLRVGVCASSYEQANVDARFDDFRVTGVPGAGSPSLVPVEALRSAPEAP